MVYDLRNPQQKADFLARAAKMAASGELAELKSRRIRSLRQNSYLHSILSYFAYRYGDTLDYVKVEYFKKAANPELFWIERRSELRGEYKALRSSASLTKEEMTLAISRFRDWSAKEAGIYLPSSDELGLLAAMEAEAARGAEYL